MKAAVCALALLAVAATAPARTVTVEKLGVTLDVPDSWADSPAIARTVRPPAELIAGVASPDGTRNFIAIAILLNPREAGSPDNFQQGLQSSLKSQGFTVETGAPVTVNGVAYESATATVAGGAVPRMQMLSTFGDGHAFTISASSGTGDPRVDADLQAIMQSFRFLTAPKPLPTTSKAYNIGYQAGRSFGMLAGSAAMIFGLVACPATAIIGAYFLFFRKKK